MKKSHATLRFKLTAFCAIIMIAMCAALAAISISASNLIVNAVQLTPALNTLASTSSVPCAEITDAIEATPAIAQRSFSIITLLAMLGVIVGGSLLIYFFVRRELRPLEDLSNCLNALSADNLSSAITIRSTGDEIEQLAIAINDMQTRVSDAYIMQKGFAQNAAHELRTPLAVMQTKIDVFKLKPKRTNSEYDALIDVMASSTCRLSALVNELLELTNNDKMDMAQSVNLKELCCEAQMDLASLSENRNISIKINGEGTVLGNDCLLQRLVFNLMQNAVKYNDENGYVNVDISQSNEHTILTVSDNGAGIADSEKSKVFDLFYRTDKSRSRELGGNGLGLAIVKRIVAQHNAVIAIKNNVPKGSVFEVIF